MLWSHSMCIHRKCQKSHKMLSGCFVILMKLWRCFHNYCYLIQAGKFIRGYWWSDYCHWSQVNDGFKVVSIISRWISHAKYYVLSPLKHLHHTQWLAKVITWIRSSLIANHLHVLNVIHTNQSFVIPVTLTWKNHNGLSDRDTVATVIYRIWDLVILGIIRADLL